MESLSQDPEFRIYPENLHPCQKAAHSLFITYLIMPNKRTHYAHIFFQNSTFSLENSVDPDQLASEEAS